MECYARDSIPNLNESWRDASLMSGLHLSNYHHPLSFFLDVLMNNYGYNESTAHKPQTIFSLRQSLNRLDNAVNNREDTSIFKLNRPEPSFKRPPVFPALQRGLKDHYQPPTTPTFFSRLKATTPSPAPLLNGPRYTSSDRTMKDEPSCTLLPISFWDVENEPTCNSRQRPFAISRTTFAFSERAYTHPWARFPSHFTASSTSYSPHLTSDHARTTQIPLSFRYAICS